MFPAPQCVCHPLACLRLVAARLHSATCAILQYKYHTSPMPSPPNLHIPSCPWLSICHAICLFAALTPGTTTAGGPLVCPERRMLGCPLAACRPPPQRVGMRDRSPTLLTLPAAVPTSISDHSAAVVRSDQSLPARRSARRPRMLGCPLAASRPPPQPVDVRDRSPTLSTLPDAVSSPISDVW